MFMKKSNKFVARKQLTLLTCKQSINNKNQKQVTVCILIKILQLHFEIEIVLVSYFKYKDLNQQLLILEELELDKSLLW